MGIYDKFIIVVDSCEPCASEYIKIETDKLKDMPDDQKKTDEIHRAIHAAYRASSKLCVRYPCREHMYESPTYHNICVEHLYKMIDAVKEFEDNANELSRL